MRKKVDGPDLPDKVVEAHAGVARVEGLRGHAGRQRPLLRRLQGNVLQPVAVRPAEGVAVGGEGGAAVGDYLEAEYGFREGTSAYMSNLWSNAFEEWSRNSRRSTTARVCYVRHPQACPAAVASERLPGAAWRLCE